MQEHNSSTTEPEHPQLRQHAQNVWEYQPQAVVAPEGSPPRIHSGEDLRQLMKAQPEAHTLFYDLFQSLNGKEVIALQAGEFAETFGDLSFRYRGRNLRTQRHCIPPIHALIVWRIRLPRSARGTRLRLVIHTGSGAAVELVVPPNPFADWARTDLFQQTQIKDFPFNLIRDHLLFHHRVHGFNRMVLYDNGSAGYQKQLEALGTLDPDLQMVMVNWPFPWHSPSVIARYGLTCGNDSQAAAFNHGFHILGRLSPFGVNLDVDEYLYSASGVPLVEAIARHTRIVPFKIMAKYQVPNVAAEGAGQHAGVLDFRYMPRNTQGWRRLYLGSGKCFYRSGKSPSGIEVEYLNIHSPLLKPGLAAKARARAIALFGHRRIFGSKYVPPDVASVYHYRGLGYDWHSILNYDTDAGRWSRSAPDSHKHVQFSEMANLMESVGLGKTPGNAT